MPSKSSILFLVIALFCVFCFSGGLFNVDNFFSGEPVSARMARYVVASAFFGGFLLLGTMGLLFMRKFRHNKGKMLLSVVYVVGSYIGIEVMYYVVNH